MLRPRFGGMHHPPPEEEAVEEKEGEEDDDDDEDSRRTDDSSAAEDAVFVVEDPLRHHHRQDVYRRNFAGFAACFAANHAAGLACLALAAASELGESAAAEQTAALYLAYTLAALLFAAPLTRRLGSKRAAVAGAALFCAYVGCFWVALVAFSDADEEEDVPTDNNSGSDNSYRNNGIPVLVLGAALGGAGAGVAWTAQGVYFAETAQLLSSPEVGATSLQRATGRLAAVFACAVLSAETALDVLATVLVEWCGVPWSVVFALYSLVAVGSVVWMQLYVLEYNTAAAAQRHQSPHDQDETAWHKVTAALRLLVTDSKMKYMLGFNAAFALAGAFLNSFVSGEVVEAVTGDSSYVGLLVAIHGVVAALCSLAFGRLPERKGRILVAGSLAFAAVALPFVLRPSYARWSWPLLVFVYVMEGVGRATFEGTLKAIFADYFCYEKEGAFANIILQYGLTSSAAYFFSTRLRCTDAASNPYCVEYSDGTLHNVLTLAASVIGASVLAIAGFLRAAHLFQMEQQRGDERVPHRPSRTPLQKRSSSSGGFVSRRTYQTLEVEMTEENAPIGLPTIT